MRLSIDLLLQPYGLSIHKLLATAKEFINYKLLPRKNEFIFELLATNQYHLSPIGRSGR